MNITGKITRGGLGLLVLTCIALAGAIALAVLHDPVPEWLTLVVIAGFSAIAGVSTPDSAQLAAELAARMAVPAVIPTIVPTAEPAASSSPLPPVAPPAAP